MVTKSNPADRSIKERGSGCKLEPNKQQNQPVATPPILQFSSMQCFSQLSSVKGEMNIKRVRGRIRGRISSYWHVSSKRATKLLKATSVVPAAFLGLIRQGPSQSRDDPTRALYRVLHIWLLRLPSLRKVNGSFIVAASDCPFCPVEPHPT